MGDILEEKEILYQKNFWLICYIEEGLDCSKSDIEEKFDQILNVPKYITNRYILTKYKKLYPTVNFFCDIEDFSISENIMNEYEIKLNMKKHIEQYPQFYHKEYISYLYKIQRSFNMIDKDKKYDWYIKLKPDCNFINIPCLDIKQKIIYISPYIWEDPNHLVSDKSQCLNENLFFCNDYILTKKCCDMLSHLKYIWIGDYSEKMNYVYWLYTGIYNYITFFDFKFYILRMNNKKQENGISRNW